MSHDKTDTRDGDTPIVIPLSSDPKRNEAARGELHGFGLAGLIYANQLHSSVSATAGSIWPDFKATAVRHAKTVSETMRCQDALEEMLVQQALWTHARVAQLTMLARGQTELHEIRILNEACNRASNTYRRLLLALAEKRRPQRGNRFVAIKQANVASQQLVQNGPVVLEQEIRSNELGCSNGNATEETIQADRGRVGLLEEVHTQHQALDSLNGSNQ